MILKKNILWHIIKITLNSDHNQIVFNLWIVLLRDFILKVILLKPAPVLKHLLASQSCLLHQIFVGPSAVRHAERGVNSNDGSADL